MRARKTAGWLLLGLLFAFLSAPYVHLSQVHACACDHAPAGHAPETEPGHERDHCDICQLGLHTALQVAALAPLPLPAVRSLARPAPRPTLPLTSWRLPRAHAPRGPPAA